MIFKLDVLFLPEVYFTVMHLTPAPMYCFRLIGANGGLASGQHHIGVIQDL